MRAIWIIGRQGLQYLLKDRTAFIWFLLVPLMYIFVFGNAFRRESDPSKSKATLAVYNQDHGNLSKRLLTLLRSDNLQIDSLSQFPEQPRIRMLSIPDSFSVKLSAGEKVQLDFEARKDASSEATMTAQMNIRKSMYRMLADLTELKIHHQRADSAGFAGLDQRAPLVSVDAQYAGQHITIPRGFSQQVPAQIVQFTLIMLFIYSASSILEERNKGLLKRIKTSSVSFLQMYLGKMLYVFLLGITQVLLILIIGKFLFGVYYGSDPVALILVSVTYILSVGSIGLCLGFMIRNQEKLVGIAISSALCMAAMSGCWWPMEISPQWMQRFSLFLPSGLALKSYHMLISFGKGLGDIWPYTLALAGITVLFSGLFGLVLYRSQED